MQSVTSPSGSNDMAGRFVTGIMDGLRQQAHEGERGETSGIKFRGSPWPRPGEGYIHVRYARRGQDKNGNKERTNMDKFSQVMHSNYESGDVWSQAKCRARRA
jgi:hypothetical protein